MPATHLWSGQLSDLSWPSPASPNGCTHASGLGESLESTAARTRLQLIVRLGLILVAAALAATTAAAVVLRDDGCADALDLFVFLFDLLGVSLGVRVKPRLAILERILDLLLLVRVELLAKAFVVARALDGRPHGMQVSVEGVLGIDALLHLLVFVGELLGLLDHLFDLILGEPSLVVGDGDLLRLARRLVLGADVEDAIRVDFEGHLNLRLTARGRGNPGELEL